MIASFRNWATGVLLWNVALDPHGGPVQPPNRGCPYCTGVIIVDEQTHRVTYGRDYYQLGQFSAFVQPGALRIGSENFVTHNSHTHFHTVGYWTDGIDDVAFLNPGGSKVVLVHNNGGRSRRFAVDWDGADVHVLPSWGGDSDFRVGLKPGAIRRGRYPQGLLYG